jgi:WW domain
LNFKLRFLALAVTMTNGGDDETSATTKETSKEHSESLDASNQVSTHESDQTTTSDQTALSNTPSHNSSDPSPWQAIFSPQYNTYYFYNTETQETTWENPLLPNQYASGSAPNEVPTDPAPFDETSGGSASQYAALQAAAIAAGIDPSLAYLDPSLLSSVPSSSAPTATGLPPSFTAKFNARTGQFTRPDGRDPTHLSEHARMTRMSEFYFDVKGWEAELAQRGGSLMGTDEEGEVEGGKKRKRPTKKDLVGVFFPPLMDANSPLLFNRNDSKNKRD